MSTFALDPNYNDFLFTSGRMSLVTGPVECAQKLNARFGLAKGEWFIDQNVGTPYFQALLVKNPNVPAITQVIRSIILGTPGVKSIASLAVAYDPKKRTIAFGPTQIVHDSGAIIVGGRGQPFIVDTKGLNTTVSS